MGGIGMVVATALGSLMVGYTVFFMATDKGRMKFNGIILEVLEGSKIEGVKIKSNKATDYGFDVEIELPIGTTARDFRQVIEALEMATNSEVDFDILFGRRCKLSFGMLPLNDVMNYSEKLQDFKHPYRFFMYTKFGKLYVDFSEESSCHLLIGGATRTGKSVLIRELNTHFMVMFEGKVKIYNINYKITDLSPFRNIKQIEMGETREEALLILNTVLLEAEKRKSLLKQTSCIDVYDFRQKFPDRELPPIFLIIDEYGQFADDDEIQKRVTKLSETSGYLDVHMVIASQRPDAQTVLKPRIRGNFLTRICFRTADEGNSKLVIGTEDAYYMRKIKGRAMVLDGLLQMVQVPFVSVDQVKKLMLPYYGKGENECDENREDATDYVEPANETQGYIDDSDSDLPI